MFPKSDPSLEIIFPNLGTTGYQITSAEDPNYNCIAWAAERSDIFLWPHPHFWPSHIPQEETIEAFIQLYSELGYKVCTNGDLEKSIEKVAIYVDAQGVPTHAARQLSTGAWTSKLGRSYDIEHHLPEGLNSDGYGSPSVYMSRSVDKV